ncbi:membrane protein [Formosa sp. Hel1_33_131]|uniref:hypothetical protein n=1 Tax=Formosa sp. Hel1_33_131 TaxID=1336794 RepID=UPI00084E196A|nr:hypothetical protein [Formosa sp. Hel1_33_131]AOR28499.1 membrane protein [Formosa sp. Hel1_33_131]
MKKTIFTLSAIIGLAFTGCMNDEAPPILQDPDNPVNPGDNIVSVSGMISESTTWTSNNIYVLNQKVVVSSGVVLTIQAGTIIKGTEGTGSLASALIVAQGGKLNAVGTATEPIIFTSINDNIEIGQTAGTNLDETNSGLWGGLIVLGYAPSSFSGDVEVVQIEGIPADDTFGLYGGTDASDNSGVYQYISIRHGGALIGEGNEINGLTLGGVGSGTIIENIEVVANVDDGIEFFGGTVNASNLLVWAQGDDALDIDQAYSGTIDNAVVILGANSDHAFEIDGPEGTTTGSFTLKNATIVGNSVTENGEYADYRSGAMGRTENIYAYGFKDSSDVELDNDGVATNYNDGLLTFGAWEIVLPAGVSEVTDIFVNKAASVEVNGFGSTATAVAQGAGTVGATTSLLSWTYANTKAELGF